MNSLWGKFAQKWIEYEYKSLNIQDAEDEKGYIIWGTEFMLVKTKIEKQIGSKPIQNGVFTLSWARNHMKKSWEKGAEPGAVCLYSDTDSICGPENSFNPHSNIIGSEMCQLELEHTFTQLICTGKKQ
ncbi:unnamed protein product [Ambrosiozyma monospora]|uniref:Unnamed protein product n=1 Tax=Ambrosiozyma monospora TaxID=43982 RepID=A0ACB5T318_AMBMO|nr:unnamed protein product [Ambrosiozyma monospora]